MAAIATTLCCSFLLFLHLVLVGAESCGDPPVPHGLKLVYESQNYFVGKIIFYECDVGFYSDSYSGTSICELLPGKSSPEWLKPDLTCTKECVVPKVPHGEIHESMFPYENRNSMLRKVSVGSLMDEESEYFLVCDPKYRPMGLLQESVQVTCRDRAWSEIPECLQAKTECEPLSAPVHGTIRFSTLETNKIGSIALFSCDPGYKLIGSTTSKCKEDIGWVFPTPNCTRPCTVPEIPHGEISEHENTTSLFFRVRQGSKIPVGTVIDETKKYVLACNSAFNMTGEPGLRFFRDITCKNGEWSTMLYCPQAKTECEPLSAPVHGTIRFSTLETNKIGSIALFSCDPGYKLIGSTTSKCMEDIGWVFPTPNCTRPCTVPEIPHGEISEHENTTSLFFRVRQGSKIPVGTVIDETKKYLLACNSAFNMTGEPGLRFFRVITCKNGEWSAIQYCPQGRRPIRRPTTPFGPSLLINDTQYNTTSTSSPDAVLFSPGNRRIISTTLSPPFYGRPRRIRNSTRYLNTTPPPAVLPGNRRIIRTTLSPPYRSRLMEEGNQSVRCRIPICSEYCRRDYTAYPCPTCKCFNASECTIPDCNPGCFLNYFTNRCPSCVCRSSPTVGPRLSCFPPACRPGCSVNYTTEPCPTCNCDGLNEYLRMRCPSPKCAPGCSVNFTTEPCPSCNCDGVPLALRILQCPPLVCLDHCMVNFSSGPCPSCDCNNTLSDFRTPTCSIPNCPDDCDIDFTSGRCPRCSCNDDESSGADNQSSCSRVVTGDSGLRIHPSKPLYAFGEMVTVSCPLGKVLSNKVERLMCLVDGWSEPVPECLNSK